MDISVIIPSLNGRKYFDEFLSSVIKECEGTPYKAEIVIVDDGSEDDSMSYLESIASDILKPYKNTKKGACSARNYAVSKSSGKYLVFLDNDVIIEKGFFEKIVPMFQDSSVGAVACAGYQYDSRQQIDGIKLLKFKRGFFRFTSNILNKDIKEDLDEYISFGVQGAYFACRRDVFDEVCGISELFEPYLLEETDLMYKILKHGYKILYQPNTHPLHKWGGTIASKVSPRTKYLSVRNKYLFNFIHLHSKKLFIQFILLNIYRVFKSNDRKALKELYSMKDKILYERKREQQLSKVTDEDLLKASNKYFKDISAK